MLPIRACTFLGSTGYTCKVWLRIDVALAIIYDGTVPAEARGGDKEQWRVGLTDKGREGDIIQGEGTEGDMIVHLHYINIRRTRMTPWFFFGFFAMLLIEAITYNGHNI